MKKILALFLSLMLVLSLAACSTAEAPAAAPTEAPTEASTEAPTDPAVPDDVTVVGQGSTAFDFHVTDLDGTVTKFRVNTDASTVGEALLAAQLIAGDESDWGLYVTSVNGITANWDTEKAYWAFYIDGEYAQTGVDATEITEGAVYSFVKTSSATTLGEGSTKINVTVKDTDGMESYFIVNTDAATVGEALLAVELIAGNESDWGLYVTTVNGITADWDTEKAYWAFYIDGEYAQTGVDATEITAGATYTFEKVISE